jgi:anti-sigma regulatory factor (Ser/Thr protein kinase)
MEQLHHLDQTITPDDVDTLRHQLEAAIVAVGGDPEAAADMILALNEALVNSVRHGYQGQPGWLRLEIWRDGRSLIVKQYDAAPPFDPTAVPPPDTTLPLALRPLGGMGIHMMRHFTDDLHYAQTTNGYNELTLVKHNAFT